MAWLNATPKPAPGTKRAENAAKLPKISRAEQMKKDKIPVRLPPNPVPAITEKLMELGLSEAAGMGAAPLSWKEIDAWCNRTAVDVPPWEARLIRRLSVEYVAESRRAEDENYPSPWRTEVSPQEIDTEEARLRMVLG